MTIFSKYVGDRAVEGQVRPAVRNRITGPGGGTGGANNNTGNCWLISSTTPPVLTILFPSGRGGRRSLGDRLGGPDGEGRREDEEDDVVNKSVMSRVVKVTRGWLVLLGQ